jgi:hypothetical protein
MPRPGTFVRDPKAHSSIPIHTSFAHLDTEMPEDELSPRPRGFVPAFQFPVHGIASIAMQQPRSLDADVRVHSPCPSDPLVPGDPSSPTVRVAQSLPRSQHVPQNGHQHNSHQRFPGDFPTSVFLDSFPLVGPGVSPAARMQHPCDLWGLK